MNVHSPVKIDKHIPYPDRKARSRFPFDEMAVGDSFLSDISDRSIMYYHMRLHSPKRFISRTVKDEDTFRLRIWRVA